LTLGIWLCSIEAGHPVMFDCSKASDCIQLKQGIWLCLIEAGHLMVFN
jgi:hypothetical protein